jgi:hypothetical protein
MKKAQSRTGSNTPGLEDIEEGIEGGRSCIVIANLDVSIV